MSVMKSEKPEKHTMAFKVDDLLINILPTAQVKIGNHTILEKEEWLWCLEHFFCPRSCTLHNCLEHHPPDEISEAFKKLKQELKEQLSRRTMAQIREEMLPQTVAQVDELKQKLRKALDELDSRRRELEHRKDK